MTTSLTERRARVYRALTEAGSYKLQLGSTASALARAREAYDVASEEPRLDPWAALAAYRLAHLLLRGPRTRETVEEADALFAEAAREALLGPYPRIYRLPLLQKLEAPRATIAQAFKAAADSYAAWTRARARSERGEDEDRAPALPIAAPIQTDLFALLELSGYFLDLDRAPLEGRGARLDEPAMRDAHWRVVGPDSALADVLVSEGTASAELDSLAPRFGAAFVFRMPPNRSRTTLTFAGAEPVPMAPRAGRLLACLLRQDARDGDALVARVMGDEGSATSFRQVKRRLREQLLAGGLAIGEDFIVEAPGQRPRLAPSVIALGAVSESAYADRE